MKQYRPHCSWCGGRGCLACPPVEMVPETAEEQALHKLLMDDGVAMVEVVHHTRVWRIPQVHPDREFCDPDPDIAELLQASATTPEQRGVAVARFDVALYCWQLSLQPRAAKRMRCRRRMPARRRQHSNNPH